MSIRLSLIHFIFFPFLLFPLGLLAQPENDEQLAAHYFQEGEYEKAELYYKKLLDEDPGRNTYFKQYVRTLLALEKYEKAEERIEERLKKEGHDPFLYVQLGEVHKKAGNERQKRKAYKNAMDEMPRDRKKIRDIAELFIERDEGDFALKVYEEGEKRLKGRYDFSFEKARTYGMLGERERMIDAYLDLLERNKAYLQSVQNGLDRALELSSDEGDRDLLRRRLLKRVQDNPQKGVYAEMLIWQYVQSNELDKAYQQAKALDKRRNEGGKKLMQLARMARDKRQWETAAKCYRYIVDLGSSNQYYLKARMELLEVMNKKVTEGDPSKDELHSLEKQYRSAIEELGRSSRTASILKDWAHLKGFYLDDPDSATVMLENTIAMNGLSDKIVAKCKLELGDQLLLRGDIWDASLYYSQVEKDRKHDPLGHEARFRNAKISFYAGEFEWAQAQLEVLKSSTSKLIANDAMELSLLITDNLNLDTTTVPMKMYAKADLLAFQKDHDEALAVLDSLEEAFPDHELADNIIHKRYEIARDRGRFEKAAEHLQRILEEHGDGLLADNAVYRLAQMNEEFFDDPERAEELYLRLIDQYPGSLYVVQARKRYRELRGDGKAQPPN